MIHSWDGSFQVWHLERGVQAGEEWEDKDKEVSGMALSPDGTVKLWNVDTGKVIRKLTGHTG